MRGLFASVLVLLLSGCGAYVELVPEHPSYQPGECVWLEVRNESMAGVQLTNACNPVLEQQVDGAFVPVEFVGHELCLLVGQGVGAMSSETLGFPLEQSRGPGTYRLVLEASTGTDARAVVSEPFDVIDAPPVENQACPLNPEQL